MPSAWIMSMSLNASANLGGQANYVKKRLMNVTASLVNMGDNAIMNWTITDAPVRLASMGPTARLILMTVQTRILVRMERPALMALPLTLALVPAASLAKTARWTSTTVSRCLVSTMERVWMESIATPVSVHLVILERIVMWIMMNVLAIRACMAERVIICKMDSNAVALKAQVVSLALLT